MRLRSRFLQLALVALITVTGMGWSAVARAGQGPPPDHFARCFPPTHGGDDTFNDLAAPDFVKEFGGSEKAARRWLDVQSVAIQIHDVMRASAARNDYMNMAFHNHRKRVEIDVRNHSHDAAIRYCARQAGINKYVDIKIHRFASRDFFHALRHIEDKLSDYYTASLFECSYGAADYYNIDVYAPATNAQYRRIKHAAQAEHVAFHIKRHTTTRPQLDTGDDDPDTDPPTAPTQTTPAATIPN